MTTTTGPARIRQITAPELAALLNSGVALELWDVRTEAERELVRIERARHLDQPGAEHIETLDRDSLLVFHCHHGFRSQAAAEHFMAKGFTNLCNLVGGIDAWSLEVDASVSRY
jgi:monothiol glutaredoxin